MQEGNGKVFWAGFGRSKACDLRPEQDAGVIGKIIAHGVDVGAEL